MKITVIDINDGITQELNRLKVRLIELAYPRFDFEFITDSIFNYPGDVLVSPANSFGVMDGSLDKLIIDNLPESTQEKVYKVISEKYNGEIPVGQAELVELDPCNWKYLSVSPTMRVPADISHTWNVYLAVRATLLAAEQCNVASVIFPGMGTGVGQVLPINFANQFLLAVKQIVSHDSTKIKRGFIQALDWYVDEVEFWKQ